MSRGVAPSTLIAFVLGAFACAYGKSVPVVIAGRAFECGQLKTLTKNLPESRVRTLLGEPLQISAEPGSTQWRYTYRFRYGDHIYFFGLTVSQPHYFGGCEAVLTFTAGALDGGVFYFVDEGPSGSRSYTARL